jgi:hypothetical protein
MDVCVRLFCICVVLCTGSGPVTGWSPVQESYRLCKRIKKLKKRPSPRKGCRAINRWMEQNKVVTL